MKLNVYTYGFFLEGLCKKIMVYAYLESFNA